MGIITKNVVFEPLRARGDSVAARRMFDSEPESEKC